MGRGPAPTIASPAEMPPSALASPDSSPALWRARVAAYKSQQRQCAGEFAQADDDSSPALPGNRVSQAAAARLERLQRSPDPLAGVRAKVLPHPPAAFPTAAPRERQNPLEAKFLRS